MSAGADAFERVVTDDGSITFAHPTHGQTYHSRAGAWAEARVRYADACGVRERVARAARSGSLVRVLDVGTGLGLNLAALVDAARAGRASADLPAQDLDPSREPRGDVARVPAVGRAHSEVESHLLAASADAAPRLEVVTLEDDPRVVRAALALGPQPLADLERAHAPVRAALAAALERPGTSVGFADVGRLTLLLGDGARTLDDLAPERAFDVVFLDPFSPAVEPALWAPAVLVRLARRMAPDAVLSTYTSSAAVRAALLAAGLAVGPLPASLGKASGTIARRGGAVPPFPPTVAAKLARRASRVAAALGMPGSSC